MSKSPKTLRRDNFKQGLADLLKKYPEAAEVKNRYKTMRITLKKEWEQFIACHDQETVEKFLQDAVYIDRLIRKETEGVDQEVKDILEEEKIEELGYGQTP